MGHLTENQPELQQHIPMRFLLDAEPRSDGDDDAPRGEENVYYSSRKYDNDDF